MPNYTTGRDTAPTPYTASANLTTYNGLTRLNTGVVDQDGTGDPIRTAFNKLLNNIDRTLTVEDQSVPVAVGKIAQRDSQGDLWARVFHGSLEGTAEGFSGALQGDVVGEMNQTRIANSTTAGTFSLLTINNRGLVTAASKPTDIDELGITNVVKKSFRVVTTNPLTGGGECSGDSITLGIDSSFLGSVSVPATAQLIPGDGIQLSPKDGASDTYRLIDNLSLTVSLTETSHGMLGSYIGGRPNQPMHSLASASTPGFMSAADKTKLDALGTGIERGSIIMWYRPLSQLPSGWRLCNGTNGTPNLIRRIPRGAANDADLGEFAGAVSHSHFVDTPGTVLTVEHLPAHQFSGTTTTAGNHYHTGATSSNGSHRHAFEVPTYDEPNDAANYLHVEATKGQTKRRDVNLQTDDNGQHAHNFTSDWAGPHVHTFFTNWLGSNRPHTHPRVTSGEATHLPEVTHVYFVMKT